MDQQAIPINPHLLQWARLEAGLSLQEAAVRAKVTPPRKRKDELGISPEQRLAAWESGREGPSLNQLEKIAVAYRRPLVTFFLPQPPTKIAPLADFRTPAEYSLAQDTPEFAALKRKITVIHRELHALAKEDGIAPLPFVGSLASNKSVDTIIAKIRESLHITFQQQMQIRSEDDVLAYFRDLAHNAGVFVLFEGDLGSYHSKISPDEFRGIAIADKIVPLIVINPNDAKAARVFTFIHEIVHIFLGASGISNLNALSIHSTNTKIERLCNAVTAEMLVPIESVHAIWKQPANEDRGNLHIFIDDFAKKFKVSGAVAGRRLVDLDYISHDEYGALLAFYQRRWEKHKARQSKKDDGPSRNILDGFRLGKKTIRTIVNAAYNGRMSLQDAARILNIPVSRFDNVMQ
jgi:Zn-dependent peptidase ImmA (M78 family)/transcriptional regulator with XRE-family HTH domain